MNQSRPKTYKIYQLTEKAVTIDFGNEICEDIFNRIQQLNQLIKQHPLPGLHDTIPAYTTLTLFFDPLELLQNKLLMGETGVEKVQRYVEQFHEQPIPFSSTKSRIITIPVCYGDTFGPDLLEVASFNHLAETEVIHTHASVIYKVYMMGFVPGFAYLGGMPGSIASPRKATPRPAIPAGSVGIAGKQTGIYPLETPGGWQLIGRTPLKLFDPNRQQPSLLQAGDHVQFKPISQNEFESYGR